MNNNNFFDSFPYLQQMGDQFQNMFGEDFVRNLMSQMQMPQWGQNGGEGSTRDRNPFGQNGFGQNGFGPNATNGANQPGAGGPPGGAAPFWNPFGGAGAPGANQSKARSYPPVDIYETRHEVVLVLEVPGIERSSDVRLSVFPDHVVVKGDVPRRYASGASGNLSASERYVGAFERNIPLPTRVKKQHAKAVYHSGLLEVRLLKEGKPDGEGSTIDVDFA